MFLWIITLLILIAIVVSYLFLNKLIIRSFEENRKSNLIRDDHNKMLLNDANRVVLTIIDQQNSLDEKMKELATLIGRHSAHVDHRQEQFNALVRADVLAARREELSMAKELKVALERLMGVAMTSRQPAAPNDIIALENLTNRIEELGGVINEMMN